MDREQIDELLKIFTDDNEEEIDRLLGISKEDIKKMTDEKIDKLYRDLMKKIEGGDYEYFKSKLKDEKYHDCVIELLEFSSNEKKEDLIQIIEQWEEYGLNSRNITDLIKAINDVNFTKECIRNGKQYGLSGNFITYLIKDLIKEINDVDFAKDCIRNSKQYGLSGSNITYLIKSLIESNDVDFAKDCIRNGKQYELDSFNITDLIKSLIKSNDVDFAEECIRNSKQYGLSVWNIDELMKSINDVDFAKDCIRNGKQYGLEDSVFSIYILISKINDVDFKKECIRNGKQYGLDSFIITNLIESLIESNDVDFKKECIRNGKQYGLDSNDIFSLINDLIKKTNDVDFARECLDKREEYGLSGSYITYLIKSINDVDFKKECIRNGKQYGLSGDYIFSLIRELNNDEIFTKECIRNGKQYGLDSIDIFSLIKEINSVDFTKECIRNGKQYGLSGDYITYLIISLKDVNFTKECLDKREEYGLSSRNIASLIESDEDFAKDCIRNGKQYGLDSIDIFSLIKEINSVDFTKECIRNGKQYGLYSNDIFSLINDLIKKTNDVDFARECLDKREEYGLDSFSMPEYLIKLIETVNKDIDSNKLLELLKIKDAEYLKKYLIENILLNNIENENIDVNSINEEIDKIYGIFLTNDLPESFKFFEFFKNHSNNYKENNYHFYAGKDLKERDNCIQRDLFKIALDSNNRQMRAFLENLHNGDIALSKMEYLDKMQDVDKAILLKYRDILYVFLDIIEPNTLKKSEDFLLDLKNIREYLNLEENENIGETLLVKYLEKIGFTYKKDEISVIKSLLNYMDEKKETAKNNNNEEFHLEEGDLIKGTNIQFLNSFLQNGIRSKEFFMTGSLFSDGTPLDADFSEIKHENLQESGLSKIINSTYSSSCYGYTFLVIKKGNYDSDNNEQSYTNGYGSNSTRYFRTGLGSTNIRAIITSEWNDEYKYILAQNEFYIPVIDTGTEKLLFTYEEYMHIREQMRGLTHYNAEEFIIDETARNENVIAQAELLRKSAEGKTSTEEKREKIVEVIMNAIGKPLAREMIGDISERSVELIDTGSTGRGTNIPGDGDFDFMLKCANCEEQKLMIAEIAKVLNGNVKGGTNEYNIRYEDVKIEGLDELIKLDITSEQKRLETEYSSDMCVRDRLESIRRKYGEGQLKIVVDNILLAKKVLKENGVYKKTGSKDSTEYGGFGGIGVENWILQNGGSFIRAMQTFLANTIDENGKELSFEEFKCKYPIYDFGQNHRNNTTEHDHYIEGLSEQGFKKLKELFRATLKELGDKTPEKENDEKFFDSIIENTKEAEGYIFTDLSRVNGLLARLYKGQKIKEGGNIKDE